MEERCEHKIRNRLPVILFFMEIELQKVSKRFILCYIVNMYNTPKHHGQKIAVIGLISGR